MAIQLEPQGLNFRALRFRRTVRVRRLLAQLHHQTMRLLHVLEQPIYPGLGALPLLPQRG